MKQSTNDGGIAEWRSHNAFCFALEADLSMHDLFFSSASPCARSAGRPHLTTSRPRPPRRRTPKSRRRHPKAEVRTGRSRACAATCGSNRTPALRLPPSHEFSHILRQYTVLNIRLDIFARLSVGELVVVQSFAISGCLAATRGFRQQFVRAAARRDFSKNYCLQGVKRTLMLVVIILLTTVDSR